MGIIKSLIMVESFGGEIKSWGSIFLEDSESLLNVVEDSGSNLEDLSLRNQQKRQKEVEEVEL